jgi:GNAT superfamily N-acetyltransferase
MLPMTMEIRPIQPEESGALARITVDAYRQLFEAASLGEYEDELANVDARRLDSEVFVADEDGVLLGGVTYVPDCERAMSEFDDPDAAGIRMLAVAPHLQGRGAGRALVKYCIERARADGRARIVLHSTPVMLVAQAMYVQLGFLRTPDLDVFYDGEPYSEAEPLHLISYTLNLQAAPGAANHVVVEHLEFKLVDPLGDLASQLLLRYYDELRERFPDGFDPGEEATQQLGSFDAPSGTFLVAFSDGDAVACGAIRCLSGDTAELKRMWVRPDVRGRGVGRSLLDTLEEAGRVMGYRRLRLDTSAHLPEAVALYRSASFNQIPDYNGNADAAFWFEKTLN